jgi:hypothetical protein
VRFRRSERCHVFLHTANSLRLRPTCVLRPSTARTRSRRRYKPPPRPVPARSTNLLHPLTSPLSSASSSSPSAKSPSILPPRFDKPSRFRYDSLTVPFSRRRASVFSSCSLVSTFSNTQISLRIFAPPLLPSPRAGQLPSVLRSVRASGSTADRTIRRTSQAPSNVVPPRCPPVRAVLSSCQSPCLRLHSSRATQRRRQRALVLLFPSPPAPPAKTDFGFSNATSRRVWTAAKLLLVVEWQPEGPLHTVPRSLPLVSFPSGPLHVFFRNFAVPPPFRSSFRAAHAPPDDAST